LITRRFVRKRKVSQSSTERDIPNIEEYWSEEEEIQDSIDEE